jgi:hypothetical protein
VADVPGLIEGASEGVGLGHEFLAHLERANLLLHVIDSSEEDAAERFRTIDAELAAYGAGLETRPQAVVLNKTDLRREPPAFDLDDDRIVRVFHVSCATGAGIDELKRALFELCSPQGRAVRSGGRARRLPRLPAEAGGRRFRVLRTIAASGSPGSRRATRRSSLRRSSGRRAEGRRGRGRRRGARAAVTTLLGGTFNPPHNGHVALAQAAEERFADEVVVLVAARPGHKEVQLDSGHAAGIGHVRLPGTARSSSIRTSGRSTC